MKRTFTLLALITVAISGCLKVEIDDSVINNGGGNTGTGTLQERIIASKTLSGNINDVVDLPKGKYTLKGYIYVNSRATLRFAAGSVIVSDTIQKGALIVERNSRLFAEGTASEPIVFTSGKPAGSRKAGGWSIS